MTATIGRPDGTINSLALLDDGLHNDGASADGVYGNGYTVTDLGGYYSVVADAAGEYDGAGYLRTAETSFSVSTESVMLTDVYSEQPLDDLSDGRFEGLEVAIGLDVSEAGSYTVSGDLYASSGEYIGHAMVQEDLALGTQDVPLYFKGADILLSGIDGPYTLTNVTVLDSERGGMLLDEGTDVYATAAYGYLEFDTFGIDCISGTGESAVATLPEDVDFSGNFRPLPGDQIAIFNVDGTICAGKGLWNGENLDIVVWGDDSATPEVDGLLPGEQLHYHIWETTTGTERMNLAASYRQGDGLYANGSNHTLDILALASQAIPLETGWNMISSQVAPGNRYIEAAVADISSGMVLIKNGIGEVYWPQQDIDQIVAWDVRHGYQLYMSAPSTLGLYGTRIMAEDLSIELPIGWSLVSYLPATPLPIADALQSLGDRLVLVKDGSGRLYWPEYGINQIGEMQPGQGYKIFMAAPALLVYPAD